jgi:hypothetical protein
MQDISALETEVNETVGAMQSAKALIDGFAARLADAGVDPAKLEALREDLDGNSTALAEAVAANSGE